MDGHLLPPVSHVVKDMCSAEDTSYSSAGAHVSLFLYADAIGKLSPTVFEYAVVALQPGGTKSVLGFFDTPLSMIRPVHGFLVICRKFVVEFSSRD